MLDNRGVEAQVGDIIWVGMRQREYGALVCRKILEILPGEPIYWNKDLIGPETFVVEPVLDFPDDREYWGENKMKKTHICPHHRFLIEEGIRNGT